MITIEEFQKLDLRIGTIKEVKSHPNADKLYVYLHDLGNEERQIIAGIKSHYKEKELLNKQIVIIVNLQPVVLRGIESQGMLLAASDDKDLAVLTPDKDISNNSKIK